MANIIWDEYHLRKVARGFARINPKVSNDIWAEPMGPDGVQIMAPNLVEAKNPILVRRMIYSRAVQYMLIGALAELVNETGHGSGMLENLSDFVGGLEIAKQGE